MSSSRSNSQVSKEKIKAIDIPTFLGFNGETTPHPSNVGINRYAFELFFENSSVPEIFKFALTSDHIEHGFQVLSEKRKEIPKLNDIIDHLFLFSFTEILFADGPIRSNLFLERQCGNCNLDQKEIRQLVDLDPEMTDSITTIYDHLIAPLDVEFDSEFFHQLSDMFDDDVAPAVSFLLRHFLHDEYSGTSLLHDSKLDPETQYDTVISGDKYPRYFSEALATNISQRSMPFIEFRMIRTTPTLYISQPKYIPPPLPSLTAVHVPKHAEFTAVNRSSAGGVYSVGPQLFFVTENGGLVTLKGHKCTVTAVAISSCGRWILSGDTQGNILLQSSDLKRHCWYMPARGCVNSVALAPTLPHQFAVGSMDGTVFLYDTSMRAPARVFVGHTMPVVAAIVHPNSEFVISTALDGLVRVWSVTSGDCVRVFPAAGAVPTVLRVSHSGHTVLTASMSGELALVDLATTRLTRSTKVSAGVTCADFSPADDIVAGVDGYCNFLVWETREDQNEPPVSIRIDRTRILALEYLDDAQVRVVCCQK